MQEGQFDNLPGSGRPIDLDGYFKMPEHLRVAFSILKSANCVPAEVELLNKIAELERQLPAVPEEQQPAIRRRARRPPHAARRRPRTRPADIDGAEAEIVRGPLVAERRRRAAGALCDNRKIWLNLRDAFPHPYTSHDAREFIRSVRNRAPETTFAIAVNGEAVGSVGFVLRHDVERVSAEIGYWIAEPFWGRGIATAALAALTEHAIAAHSLTRVYALPFAWNTASCRVLEKAGYQLEARLRRSAIKNGVITESDAVRVHRSRSGPAAG